MARSGHPADKGGGDPVVPASHVFDLAIKQDMDARARSAFTRVSDALCAGMTI
jgi:hypothetical protein